MKDIIDLEKILLDSYLKKLETDIHSENKSDGERAEIRIEIIETKAKIDFADKLLKKIDEHE